MKKLEQELAKYAKTDAYPFHMPGHKRRMPDSDADGAEESLARAAMFDITEIDGFDNLHDPEDLIRGEMEFAARYYGAADTFFSVNGSTCAILTAISAAVPRGGTILIERGCHISVYHAAYLRGLNVRYLAEGRFYNHENTPSGDPDSLAGADAVVITSPSYEGFVKNVKQAADEAHAAGAVLIVDEAHGAHFSGHGYFPESAVRLGADLVIESMHKTLPALTQTALLHNVTGRVPSPQLQKFLDIYETSSPSYLLMASMTGCIHRMADEGEAYFEEYVHRLREIREKLVSLQNLTLVGNAEDVAAGRYDPGKIYIRVNEGTVMPDGTPLTGPLLYEILRSEFLLQPEMKTEDSVLMMTSPADTAEGFGRLEEALFEIDGRVKRGEVVPKGGTVQDLPPAVMTIAEAADAQMERVPLKCAVGRVAADYVIVFPPDTPLIVPGEVFTEGVVRRIKGLMGEGALVGVVGSHPAVTFALSHLAEL